MSADTKERVGQHTEGPWFASQDTAGWSLHAGKEQADDDYYWIGRVDDVNGHGENEANARLIAAAPDLLREAKAAAQWLEELGKDPMALRAAIAKAEGNT